MADFCHFFSLTGGKEGPEPLTGGNAPLGAVTVDQSRYTGVNGLLRSLRHFFLFFYSPVFGAGGGEKAKRSGKNTIRIKGQDSKPRS